MAYNGPGYDFVLVAASPAVGLRRLAEEINEGKTKLLSLALNLFLCFKNRINFEVRCGQKEIIAVVGSSYFYIFHLIYSSK